MKNKHQLLCRPGLLAIPFTAALLHGCGGAIRHEVNTSPYLKQHPVSSVYVHKPAFKEKVKRFTPADLEEMLPANQPATAAKVTAILKNVLSASIAVDSQFVPDAKFDAWAAKIQKELCYERVPFNVPPIDVPVESVLLWGVMSYGTEVDQLIVHPLPFLPFMKQYKLNEAKWNYVSDLIAILISPRDGKVLFDVRNGERKDKIDARNEAVLDELTRLDAWAITSAFPPAPGYVSPAPAAPTDVAPAVQPTPPSPADASTATPAPAAPAPAAPAPAAGGPAVPDSGGPKPTVPESGSPATAPATPAQPVPDEELR